jgi:hypothetical protein
VASTELQDKTFSNDDVSPSHPVVSSAAACCDMCAANAKCVEWAWHGGKDQSLECHLHGSGSSLNDQKGTVSGVMQRPTGVIPIAAVLGTDGPDLAI